MKDLGAVVSQLGRLVAGVMKTLPEVFRGRLAQYWPLIVMGLAFLGIGLSEFFQRRGVLVLAGPLQRTGIFLPLLPLFMFWLRLPEETLEQAKENFPGLQPILNYVPKGDYLFDRYAMLWFLLGVLYAWLAVTKRSFRFALLGALAANVGLWTLFYHSWSIRRCGSFPWHLFSWCPSTSTATASARRPAPRCATSRSA